MKKEYKQKREQGFTIIEVMIVLAIAAVILLIVLLAVPALQRSSRNTQRKNDVASMLTAVNNYVANHNSTFPASGQFSTAFPDTPNLAYYTTPANLTWTNQSSPTAPGDPASADKVHVVNNATCDSTGTGAQTSGANTRSIVAVYDIETSSGTPQEQCQQG